MHRSWLYSSPGGSGLMELPHRYVLGETGTGKSTHVSKLTLDAIRAGHGVFFLDPHGEDSDKLLDHIPKNRRRDVIIFDPIDFPIRWNPLVQIPEEQHPLIAATFVDTIRATSKLDGGGTALMDMYVRSSVYAMLELERPLTDIPAMLRDTDYRKDAVDQLRDGPLRDFWTQFDDLTGKEQRDETRSTYNKIHPLLLDYRIREVLDGDTDFSMSDVVEQNRILLVRLPQGKLGMGMTELIGSLFMCQVHVALLGRENRTPFEVVIDEAHLFAPSPIAEMVTGLRKFGARVTLAHQSPSQLDRDLFRTIMSSCQDKHIFRLSQEEGELFHKPIARHSHIMIDELPDYTYRKFPVVKGAQDVTISPLGEPLARSRSDIEKHMQTAYGG